MPLPERSCNAIRTTYLKVEEYAADLERQRTWLARVRARDCFGAPSADEDEAALDLAQLRLAEPPPLAADIAVRASLLRAHHYHRRDRAVSLADCVAAETARAFDSPLATSNSHVLDTCAAEGVAVIALPDSRGTVWAG